MQAAATSMFPHASVLIVDDDPVVRVSLVDELSNAYAVTSVGSAEDALELLRTREFDAVISDMRMPGMTGIELLSHPELSASGAVRILLTGYADCSVSVAAQAPEGFYKLAKPWGDELDITLRRALEQRQQLRQAQEQLEAEREARQQAELSVVHLDKLASLGTLAAGIAHEMRSPLAYLQANFDWLKDGISAAARTLEAMALVALPDEVDPEAREEARALWKQIRDEQLIEELEAVRQECGTGLRRLADILEGLRVYASPRSSQKTDAVNVCRCIDEAVRLVRCKYKHDITIHVDAEPALPDVQGRAGELGQILINLLVNGIQAMEGRGEIFVRVWRQHAGVCIEVEDQGPGIPPERVEYLFQPFQSTKEHGNGLGLSISREIARRHGGDLRYRPGATRGAIFTLDLSNPDATCPAES